MATQQPAPGKLPAYVVAPHDDTLFVIHNGIGSLGGSERAKRIASRLEETANTYDTHAVALTIIPEEGNLSIYRGENILMSVTPQDAFVSNQNIDVLANRYKSSMATWINSYQKAHRLRDIIRNSLLALLVTAILIALIWGLNRGRRWLDGHLEGWKAKYFKGIKLKDLQLVDADNEVRVLRISLSLVRYLFILILVYIYLPVLFSIFPFTQSFAGKLFGYILQPLKKMGSAIIDYVPNLITVVVIWLVFRYLIRAVAYFANEVKEGRIVLRGFYPDWARTTFSIVRFLLYAFMFVILFPYLPGSDSPIFKGVSVFIGLLISIGSSTIINNLMAGIVVTYMRAFRVGEYVKIGDTHGVITEKSIFVVKLRTHKNEEITIPNSTILSSQTLNYSVMATNGKLILYTSVTIGYDAPWRTVHQLLIDAALATTNVLHDPAPFVLQTSLDDFYISYQINAYTNQADMQPRIYSELHSNIQDKFNQAGVEIMSPHYAQLRDGNETTIPEKYRTESMHPNSFRVDVTASETKH